jgi:uncharacterized protein YukE
MTDPGFSVSLPDLRGCADQLSALAGGYRSLGDVLDARYTIAKEAADMKSLLVVTSASFIPALSAFQEKSDELVATHCSACKTVMSDSMDSTAGRLAKAANSYQKQDQEAEAELDGENPSKDAKKTADAITGGEPNSDWSTDFDPGKFLEEADVDGTVYPEMSFEPTMKSTMETLESALDAPSLGTVDAVIQYFCGFSIAKEVVKPMLGDWGVLWFMADLNRGAAGAIEEIARIVTSGADTLVDADWSGDAANAYVETSKTWQHVLFQHADLFRRSAGILDDTANRMDVEGGIIADATMAVADFGLAIAMALAGRGRRLDPEEIMGMVQDLIELIPQVLAAIDSFQSYLDLAQLDVGEVISEIASLNPPGNLQDTDS